MARGHDHRLLVDAMGKLHLGNDGLGRLCGLSGRTVQRWWSAESQPWADHYRIVARAVYPHDRELARRLAERGGTTLEALGVEPADAAAPALSMDAGAWHALHADGVVHAVAAAFDRSPLAVRPLVAIAFAKALELGSDLPALARLFAAEVSKKKRGPRAAPPPPAGAG